MKCYICPQYGITADDARILKLGVDMDNNSSPLEKYLAKRDISAQIADPIDREAELRCDNVDWCKECIQSAARYFCPPFCVSLAEDSIAAQAERQKQNIFQTAEKARRYRDMRPFLTC